MKDKECFPRRMRKEVNLVITALSARTLRVHSYALWGALLLLCAVLAGCEKESPTWRVAGGNADSGELLLQFYQCGSCHVIPGLRGANGVVGPPLTSFAKRSFIAGAVPNEPDNLIQWLIDPQEIEPGTAMPALGVTSPEARDMAAYLYTLH